MDVPMLAVQQEFIYISSADTGCYLDELLGGNE